MWSHDCVGKEGRIFSADDWQQAAILNTQSAFCEEDTFQMRGIADMKMRRRLGALFAGRKKVCRTTKRGRVWNDK